MVFTPVVRRIADVTGLDESSVHDAVEVPPSVAHGDYAYPCFDLAQREQEDPTVLAERLASQLTDESFERVESQGPYVNITVRGRAKLDAARSPDLPDGSDTVIVESPSPNTNKPLHVGHALNMVLGQSIANILEACGHEVVKENLYNDRGIHIMKSMVAYQRDGEGATPSSEGVKPDHFVGDYYVQYESLRQEDPSIEDDASNLLQAWEDGDEATRSLWATMRDWCLQGIKQTIGDYGVTVDTDRFESDIYDEGRRIVEEGLDNGVFERADDGSVVADLSDEGLGTKHVLRSDGTTVYLTQDLGLARRRATDVSPDRIVHVVGKEQEYHFNCLFTLLDRLGFDFADTLFHRSYGHVRLPEGAMSSREGTAVHADTIREDMVERAEDEIKSRHDLGEEAARQRAESVGMAALKFYLLRTDPKHDITFDPEESLSFTGETGPYVQYTYARIQSLLDDAGGGDVEDGDLLVEDEERRVLRLLLQYAERLQRSSETYDPSIIANYVLQLAQAFNEFYHAHTVIGAGDVEGARIALCRVVADRVRTCLGLLGIDAVEEM